MFQKTALFALTLTLVMFLIFPLTVQAGGTINGAGASFPYPLYSQWAYEYNQLTGMKINYQSIGSGGGIRQIKAKTVDFGASDAPLKAEELDEFDMIQFPMIMGGVVPVVNIDGIGQGELKLDSKTLVDIFLGKIEKWNDTAIKKLNPGLKLPKKAITIVHRADGSGTTWIFTKYLAKVSKEWADKVGANKAVSWPVGVGGKGNEGVASYVKRVKGSIGYVEFAYAIQNKLSYILLQNKDGNYVAPTKENFMSAAGNADWANAPGFYLVLVDQPGEKSWPITGASFIIIYKDQKNLQTIQGLFKFFDWCYKHGQNKALELDYVPMPENVVKMVQDKWKNEVKYNNKPAW